MLFTSLDDPEFTQLFRDFEHTAFRLETLQAYDVTCEGAAFDRFLAGEERGVFPGISDWIDGIVAEAVRCGKRMHRVHVVQQPLTDYVRFECAWAYSHTIVAGEDVRIVSVPPGDAWPVDLPRYDYWLFDSRTLVAMDYHHDGTFASAEVIDDQYQVVEANYWRDVAVTCSVSYQDFAQSL